MIEETEHHYDKRGRTIYFVAAGKVYLMRCPECERENYGPMVSSGQCAWCGYVVTRKTLTQTLVDSAKEIGMSDEVVEQINNPKEGTNDEPKEVVPGDTTGRSE